jgi:electron transfer flavoprotein alpha subunit
LKSEKIKSKITDLKLRLLRPDLQRTTIRCRGLIVGNGVKSLARRAWEIRISKVIVCENEKLNSYSTTAYSKAIAETANKGGSNIIFISATAMGKDVAPRVAAKLEAGLASDCTELRIEDFAI